MSAVELAAGAVLTLLLHATLLLGAVWFAERCGALKHPGWAELAWRLALFGALATTSLQVARTWPSVQTPRAEAATHREFGGDVGDAGLAAPEHAHHVELEVAEGDVAGVFGGVGHVVLPV